MFVAFIGILYGAYVGVGALVKMNLDDVSGLSVMQWNTTTSAEQFFFTDGYIETIWQARGNSIDNTQCDGYGGCDHQE